MRSTNVVVTCVWLALLGGCASQDTVLPPTEKTMLEIYRSAVNTSANDNGGVASVTGICAQLDLDESNLSCEEMADELPAVQYQRLDDSPPQPLEYLPYTRTQQNELDNLFPRLENPDLAIYIYPHLATRTRVPIPGYTTVIPLYERVEYGLPGESLKFTPTVAEAIEVMGKEQSSLSQGVSELPASDQKAGRRYAKPGNMP